jgi:hypothetical protein
MRKLKIQIILREVFAKHKNENFVSAVAYKIQDIVAHRVAAPGEKMAAFF